jgi:hypothetical protein
MRRRFLKVCSDDIGALIERQRAFKHVRGIVLTGVELKGLDRDTLMRPRQRPARRLELWLFSLRLL